MKRAIHLLILLSATIVTLTSCNEQDPFDQKIPFSIKGTILNEPYAIDSLRLWRQTAEGLRWVSSTPAEYGADSAQVFTFTGTVPGPGIYFLGYETEGVTEVILGEDELIELQVADMSMTRGLVYTQGEANQRLLAFSKAYYGLIRKQRGLYDRLQHSPDTLGLRDEFEQAIQESKDVLQQYITTPGALGKYVQLIHSPEPEADGSVAGYANQTVWFVNGFFDSDSLSDPYLGYIPQFPEKALHYGKSIYLAGLTPAGVAAKFDSLIALTPEGSFTREQLITALLLGSIQNGAPEAVLSTVGKDYIRAYPGTKLAEAISDQLESAAKITVGSQAPEIILPDKLGNDIALSSLAGKLVLVDFWASWCKPCRYQNPELVRLYEQYKDQGFEIYGLSLDQSAAAWQEAVDADSLPWIQVLENPAREDNYAQQFGVQSIPFNFLVSADGTVIGKNLRGAELRTAIEEALSKQ